ncbi:hypothetical protein CC1G_14196 [Coprinopsis cinerea okayama7|uniref:Uncharacterized protein n=1 Tax=Coprinopsis cinerea (strain Okayama-7 / 130 / ATCC MYA-4618 / FGSC 9003) TaxID=240176 RepID=D6RLM5_COPC7|nr:hypothetical protein CC1G_14196 [Coprinopsis cinerea okayama7\|eukprot:XP_002911663.1 hypothetical protein CC1G_14196 [Coprinopsis cinerea okayama7\
MPVPLWTTPNKAEAKYNVVTEFPQLGLHAAAASGNVGLVEYALEHGQPINSVLDGVLPIHAASAGGHPQVVKKLIEHGADVNAPRLPRRYFNDKNRDASAPIVGTSYSTPLHFAAANGNTDVVTLLLLHGAHPDREDKHGVTPEDLARANNWIECAQILRDWVVNKDRDLREREVLSTKDGNGAASSSSQALQLSTSPEPESPSFRRRLHVKQSIDTALNKLKTGSFSETSLKPGPAVSMGSPPHSPMNSFGNYSFDPDARENHSTHEPASRRPSLPQIPQPSPVLDETGRRNTTSSGKMRRPRSAGTGAEPSGEQDACYTPYGRGGAGRRLASKISLLGMFKKAQSSDTSEGISSANTTPVKGSASTTTLPLTPNAPSHGRANKDDTQGGLSPDPIEQPQAEDTAPALNDKQEPTQSNHRPPDVDVEGKGKDAHQSSEPQPRPRSFGSASRSSLSPVFTNDNTAQSLAALQSDFPFSIHQPPPTENKSPMNRQLQLPEVGRGRGDSLSSTWTSDSSGMPQYSTGGSTINSSPSPVLHTPGNHTIALPTSKKISDDEETYNHIIRSDSGGSESVRQSSPRSNGQITLNERRAHSPLDIDIGAISSHEQAKALVEKTRQDILELASGQDVGLTVSNTGSTPLSAKLAAYGESLALQRRLEEQEKMGQESTPPSADDIISAPARFVGHGVERQLSLDKAGRNHKPRTRGKDPRRPSTADGLSSRGPHNSFFPGEHIRTHQSSMSVSPPGIAQASSTSFDGREFLSSHQRFPASITPSKSLMTVPEPLLSPITPHPIAESDYGSEAPSDFADTETESSPFPSRHTALVSATGLPRNKLPVMARSHNSAKKLNRMGFTVVDQVARPVAQPHSGKLLGGFKSIMQSLKGK